jgi:GTP-binding protein
MPLRIDTVTFERSASRVEECPNRPLPEIAVSGRSNVGKSSLLNSLLSRRALARVSATPGKTQLLNYFLVDERFHLVDLPGYGYARAPVAERERWRRMMQGYLRRRTQLCGVVQLVDARHEPSREDREMVRWLLDEKLAFCLVPTKMDKLRQGERKPALARLVRSFDLPPDQPMVPYSSRTAEGREALLDWLERTLAGCRTPPEP